VAETAEKLTKIFRQAHCPVPKEMVRPSTATRYQTSLLLTRAMNPEMLHLEGHGNKFALSLGLSMPN